MLNDQQFEAYNALLKQIYGNRDIEQLRSIVLSHLPPLVPYDSAAFFLVDPTTHHFLEPCNVGLDLNKHKQYQDYYESLDLYKKAVFSKGSIPPVDRSSDYMNYAGWAKNEHRCDFLLPQGIYHIACLQVLNGGFLLGEISLHRSEGSPDFSDSEMALLKSLHDHLNNAFLEHKRDSGAIGLCEMDCKYNIIDANIPAREILQQRLASGQSVYSYLKEICQSLVNSRKARPITGAYYWNGNLSLRTGSYPIKTIFLEGEEGKKDITFLNIIQLGHNHGFINTQTAFGFELTKREIEIAALVARGNTNLEI
ncbi:hypothetical protein L7E55_05845 [Pelotomaculum isophthalicicum JI]|uniref:GAF domain-containing protein n=1 Tax=Pelotomaculum isophthalicicum JI TaxID=947010 RepID=A0A9X4JTS5_9FIRM|nr:hypothetical protein [Pelotomaculum isophthalicicum]MDF9407885.1 hypothetical protein [Pelotomaculum isophthalicicum JI]